MASLPGGSDGDDASSTSPISLVPTFAAFQEALACRAGFDGESQLAKWLMYDQAIHDRVEEMRQDPNLPTPVGQLVHHLALDVIESHLGEHWLMEHVGEAAGRGGYLVPPAPGLQRVLTLHRIHEFARRLYEFQSYAWFDDALARLRTRDLSGASFELDVIWLFTMAASPVDVRVEVGRKGEDYDLVAVIKGEPVPVEVKTKEDDTPFTAGTVAQTIKAAAGQLPKGRQGIIFIRLPFGWVGPRLEAEYNDALADRVRQTSRVGAIMTVIDKPTLSADGRSGSVTRVFSPFAAPECPPDTWDFLLFMKDTYEAGLHGMAPGAPF